jgi:hypothetical protein
VGPNGQLLHPLHGQATEFLEGQKTRTCGLTTSPCCTVSLLFLISRELFEQISISN